MLGFAVERLAADFGVMITASHNPKEYNGIKIFKRLGEMEREDWKFIKKTIISEREEIEKMFGEELQIDFEEKNIFDDYKKFVENKLETDKKYKIVVDASNGPAGKFYTEILSSLGFEVIKVACEVDPDFPSHSPDPSKEENTTLCKDAVKEHKADLGICFDGDGDRAIFIDDKGRFIPGDYALAILSLGYENPVVVTEVKVSKAVVEFIEKRGKVILERVGSPFIRKRIKKGDAILGGELSGHYFFRDVPFDDGLIASIRLINILSSTDKRLSDLFDAIPKYFTTPEYRIKVEEEKKFEIVENAKRFFEDKGKVIDIDGVRVELSDCWGLLRASNTEPKISLRFEGKSKEALNKIVEMFNEYLKKYGIEVK
jgi:phosphomannomutase/phosphoglucomutase